MVHQVEFIDIEEKTDHDENEPSRITWISDTVVTTCDNQYYVEHPYHLDEMSDFVISLEIIGTYWEQCSGLKFQDSMGSCGWKTPGLWLAYVI